MVSEVMMMLSDVGCDDDKAEPQESQNPNPALASATDRSENR